MLHRRSFLTGLIAAPLVVKANSLMKIKGVVLRPRLMDFPSATEIMKRYYDAYTDMLLYGRGSYEFFGETIIMEYDCADSGIASLMEISNGNN